MKRSLPLSGLVTAGVLCVSTGCGSSSRPASTSTLSRGGSSSATSARSSAPPSTPVSPTAPSIALNAITVQRSDLSPGWRAITYEPNADNARYQAALVRCVGGRDTSADRVAEAHSPDYSQGSASVASRAVLFKSLGDVAANVQILSSPKINSCYETLARAELTKSVPTGTTINKVTITVTPGPGAAPSNVAGTIVGDITLTANGQTTDAFLNVALITGPLVAAEIDFENVGAPIPAALRNAVITRMAARAAHPPLSGGD
jgi:hypothetical protein